MSKRYRFIGEEFGEFCRRERPSPTWVTRSKLAQLIRSGYAERKPDGQWWALTWEEGQGTRWGPVEVVDG